MKSKIIISAAALLLLQSNISTAGLIKPTAHSRANCGGNNESITWHLGHSYWWRVESHHMPTGWKVPKHIWKEPKEYTWRFAAVCWNEAYSSRGDRWQVNGYHFFYPNNQERLDSTTGATDCNIYEGWWDY